MRGLIESGAHPASEVEVRVRLLNVATRPVLDAHFEVVASALLGRHQLEILYYGRGRDESRLREVSPQQLLYYRGNWYLIAWCHLREAIRSFAMDSIETATTTAKAAKEIPKADVAQFVGKGYGIFSGNDVQWATLQFSTERARWVARETWHRMQKTQTDSEGRLLLQVPFTDARELAMDILRHGSNVEVIGPPSLRRYIREELVQAVAAYTGQP